MQKKLILLRLSNYKYSLVHLPRFEPLSSCLDSCIQNTKLQIQLMISPLCVKVRELWNQMRFFKLQIKIFARALFQSHTYSTWSVFDSLLVQCGVCEVRMLVSRSVCEIEVYWVRCFTMSLLTRGQGRGARDSPYTWQSTNLTSYARCSLELSSLTLV